MGNEIVNKKTPLFLNTDFKAGIAPGSHVIHIIGQSDRKDEISINDIPYEPADFNNISQKDAYTNKSDIANAEFLIDTALFINDEYMNTNNAEYENVLRNMRDYITADSRRKQQTCLSNTLSSMNAYLSKYDKFTEEEKESNKKIFESVSSLRDKLTSKSMGNLENAVVEDKKNVTEPSYSGVSGFFSVWTDRSKDALFPHDPSPNDIKQGVGLEDCYMLSALTQIASKNPQKIKDAMKDNGNGTVTVRFYDQNKSPVDITVKKTESRIMGFGGNSYASGSLWVQMMEKAYAKYNDKMKHTNKGLSGINRSNTAEFMNAFDKDGDYSFSINAYGDLSRKHSIKEKKEEGYSSEDKALFYLFKERVGEKGEVITVGNQETGAKKREIKSDGIRTGHAYAVLNAFEKNVNGERKLYVTLRDPYATFSSGYDKKGNLVNTSQVLGGTFNAGTDQMGTFNMELKDFKNHFDQFTGIESKTSYEFDKLSKFFKFTVANEEIENKAYDMLFSKETPEEDKQAFIDLVIEYDTSSTKAARKSSIIDFVSSYFSKDKSPEEKKALWEEIKHPKADLSKDISTDKQEKSIKEETIEKKDPQKDSRFEDDFLNDFENIKKPDELKADEPEMDDDFAVIDEEDIAFASKINSFASRLKNAESFWRNSDQYKKLEEVVNNCNSYNKEELANKITLLGDAYLKHKAKDGIDAKSQNKVALVKELMDISKDKATVKLPIEKEKTDINEISKGLDKTKEVGKSKVSDKSKTFDDFEVVDDFSM